MKIRLSLLLIVLIVAFITSCAGQQIARWNEDLDFWLSEIKKQHYVYRSKPLPIEFQEKFEKLKSQLGSYTDQRILIELVSLSALLGDGHTYVLPWGAEGIETRILPLRFYLFEDGLFVIDAWTGYEEWIGKKVTQIGDIKSDEAMLRVARFISRDNDQGINWIGPFMLSFEGILQALGVEGDGVYTLSFEHNGQKLKKQFPVTTFHPAGSVPKLIPSKVKASPIPLYLENVEQHYWIKSLRKDHALYVQFNQVFNDRKESLRQFAMRLNDSIQALNPQKLIIDVRHNNGGNAELLGPLLAVLQQYKSLPGSRLYMITGRNTFSAAQIFISKADLLVKPIFGGESSSSKPNFVGEENPIRLPNCKAICSISNRYHESIPGDTRQAIQPRIRVMVTSTDYFNGRDPVLEKILKD